MGDTDRDQELKRRLHLRLVETGEKERLKERLRFRLHECGWKEDMRGFSKAYVKKRGLENVKFDEILEAMTPKGRESIPKHVKQELLSDLKSFYEKDVIVKS